LVSNNAVANLIRENKTYQINSAMQTGRKDGMMLMDTAIQAALRDGKIDGRSAWESANDKTPFMAYAPKEHLAITQLSNVGTSAAKKVS